MVDTHHLSGMVAQARLPLSAPQKIPTEFSVGFFVLYYASEIKGGELRRKLYRRYPLAWDGYPFVASDISPIRGITLYPHQTRKEDKKNTHLIIKNLFKNLKAVRIKRTAFLLFI